MLYRPSPFRKSAFALTTVAAIAGASVLASFPAAAQQKTTPIAASTEQVTVDTDCKTFRPGVLMADTKCEILKGEALDAQNRALDARGNTLASQNACIAELLKFKKNDPDKFTSMGFGKITRDNACGFATRIPKQSASLQQ